MHHAINPSPPVLNTIILYARDVQRSATFYATYFGFEAMEKSTDGMQALTNPAGGTGLLIHQAAKSVKLGQAGVKLSFSVQNVETFVAEAANKGLKFGAIHQANGYQFANTKDPDKNSVSVSSRAFRR